MYNIYLGIGKEQLEHKNSCVLIGWMLQGVAKLKQNPEELDRILKNHIVRGKVQ
jgi:hypothetical protein